MGKHIIRVTRMSCRSLFLAYSRLMTLVFALFCAVSGQLPKSATGKSVESSRIAFKGTAHRSSDSTVLRNVRLYLQECLMPLYGIYPEYGVQALYGIAPEYGISYPVTDTVRTDTSGAFNGTLSQQSGNEMYSVTSEVIDLPSGKTYYRSSDCITISEGIDSTYSLYLDAVTTNVKKLRAAQSKPLVESGFKGDKLQLTLPGWDGRQRVARIVNSRGEQIASLTTSSDGMLTWDTRAVAKGVYFLRMQVGQQLLSLKVLVQ